MKAAASWVTIDDLRVAYGPVNILDGIRLQVPRGSLVAVLGPSGCGKTTLLRAIAGLLPVHSGSITVGDRLLSSAGSTVAPEKRGMGWVPQDASLFPHLSVGDNIGFGLGRAGKSARVAELAAIVGLAGFEDRAPSQLSGGQAQRVALARALAARPDLMLLDEPFAALDPLLRSALRTEVAELLRDQENTTLLVTHDQEEALSLADYVAVMRGGRIEQFGTPADVYERPANLWVAGFVGDTVKLNGTWIAEAGGRGHSLVDCELGRIRVDPAEGFAPEAGDSVRVMLRPEWLRLAGRGTDARVGAIAYAGHDALVGLKLRSGALLRARIAAPDLPRRGAEVTIAVRRPAIAFPQA